MTTGQLTTVSTPADAADPEDLGDLADRYGYHLELSALAAPGHVHAAFTHHDTLTVFPPHTPPAADTNNPAAAHHRTQLRTQLTRDLTTHTRQRLPDYMVPTTIRILDTLPLTPTGKLDRRGLAQLPLHVHRETFVEPATDTEIRLARLWREELGLSGQVSANDNFFDLGGHSLLALSLFPKIGREFRVRFGASPAFRECHSGQPGAGHRGGAAAAHSRGHGGRYACAGFQGAALRDAGGPGGRAHLPADRA